MSFLKKHKYRLTALVFAAAVLVFAFWRGANAPMPDAEQPTAAEDIIVQASPEPSAPEPTEIPETGKGETEEKGKADPTETPSAALEDDTVRAERNDEAQEADEPVSGNTPSPTQHQDAAAEDKELTCTLSVRCDTIFDNIGLLNPEKAGLVPDSGVILAEQTVVFYEGESVFNLLLREMKKNKIHLEFENTPIYNSAFIEGIGNLYEHDCGELSGWMYKVNGEFPNYGCSKYQLKAGDKVEWVYTCNLGADVGGSYIRQGE